MKSILLSVLIVVLAGCASGSALVFSTYLGGTAQDRNLVLAVDL